MICLRVDVQNALTVSIHASGVSNITSVPTMLQAVKRVTTTLWSLADRCASSNLSRSDWQISNQITILIEF